MRDFTTALGRRLAPHKPKLLHLLFLGSLGCLGVGWFLFERVGPMSIILPLTLTIGTGLSEVDRLYYPLLRADARSRDWVARGKRTFSRWSTETRVLAVSRRPADFEE